MRGYEMKREAKRYENADLVMMYMRSQGPKKQKSIDDILGKEQKMANKGGKVVSLDDKRKELDFLSEVLGEAVNR